MNLGVDGEAAQSGVLQLGDQVSSFLRVVIVLQVDETSLSGDAGRVSHIKGQAYAVRALAHFDLLRQYGQHFIDGQGGAQSLGVPYMKTYKDASNLQPARETVLSNVGDIQSDLTTAITLMNSSTLFGLKKYSAKPPTFIVV